MPTRCFRDRAGLGGGAIPLVLRKRCPDGPRLNVVDASADALFIARTFVYSDDGRLTTFEKALGQDAVARAEKGSLSFVRRCRHVCAARTAPCLIRA